MILAISIAVISFAWLAWRDFDFAIAFFLFLSPVYLLRLSFGPIPTTVLELLFLILLFRWLYEKKSIANLLSSLKKVKNTTFFWPGLLLVLGATLSIFFAIETLAALGIWKAYFIEPFLFYLLLCDQLKTKQAWQKMFIGLGGLVIVVSLVAIYQGITGAFLPTWEWSIESTRRATSFFTSPNALGLLVGPLSIFFLGWFFYEYKQKNLNASLRFFQLLTILFGATAIRYSVSRGAMIAIVVGIIYLLWRAWSKKGTAVISIIALVLAFSLPALKSQVTSIASFQVDSGQSRLALYKGTATLLKSSPIVGLGLASFSDRFEEVREGEFTEKLIYPHNIFLNFWSETGVLGLIALLWIIILITKVAWNKKAFDQADFFIAALLVMFIHGLVDVNYFKNDLALLSWYLLAGLSFETQAIKVKRGKV